MIGWVWILDWYQIGTHWGVGSRLDVHLVGPCTFVSVGGALGPISHPTLIFESGSDKWMMHGW